MSNYKKRKLSSTEDLCFSNVTDKYKTEESFEEYIENHGWKFQSHPLLYRSGEL